MTNQSTGIQLFDLLEGTQTGGGRGHFPGVTSLIIGKRSPSHSPMRKPWHMNSERNLSGLFIPGLGIANLHPVILSLAINAAGENTVRAGARATPASGTAILALPLLLGRLPMPWESVWRMASFLVLLISVFMIIQTARRSSRASHPIHYA